MLKNISSVRLYKLAHLLCGSEAYTSLCFVYSKNSLIKNGHNLIVVIV